MKIIKISYKISISYFKIALRPSSIPAKVSNFRNFSVSGKERARERKVGLRNLRASSLAKTTLRLVKPQNKFVKMPVGIKDSITKGKQHD